MGLFSKFFGEPASPEGRARPSHIPSHAGLKGKRILLVEPSITIQKIVELTLDGATLVTTKDAKGAEAALRDGRFELVMTATILGDVTGYDLCASVKSQAAPIPVILLRGSYEPFDEERARQAGADAVITKPFAPDAFKAEITRVLAR